MSLKGRVTLVTGASRGIGREIARLLAEEGSDLLLVARPSPDLEEVRRECAEKGVRAESAPLDLGDADSLERLVPEAIGRFPRIDHLVNNAGATRDGLLMRMKRKDWEDVLAVNLTAAYVITRAVVPAMLKARYGRIVNISSVIGEIGNIGQANYAASKAGLFGLTMSMARECANKGITVNSVAPGFIRTEMVEAVPEEALAKVIARVPCGRLGEVDEVARVVEFLVDPASSYITGDVYSINGGLSM